MADTAAAGNVSSANTALAVQVTERHRAQKPLWFAVPQLISFPILIHFHSSFPFYPFYCFH